ncbi:MAG: 2-hydroxyacid dehydrogenase [Candidatus Dojkabacteria bacterium]|jgi:lactate dehydrogenase-like 2-hydroxyacid dehydrogenase
MKIYITYTKDSFKEEQINNLENTGEVIFLEDYFDLDKASYLKDSDEKILVVDPDWYDWNLDEKHLKKVENLKAVCLSTTAYDWIDLEYCKKNKIVVTNIPKYSTDSVAEYAVFLMMCLARKFPIQLKNDYKTEYSVSMLNTEVRNKTVGIIGLGTIGIRIAEMCQGLGMNVIYWNRTKKENNYKAVDLETIFTTADFVIPAFSTNNETKKIITDELINKMFGNFFINIINNPEEIYNHKLLIERAEKEEIGYAFEIYGNGKKIYEYKGNIMATAPYAFYTKEAIERLIEIWCQNVIAITSGKPQNKIS